MSEINNMQAENENSNETALPKEYPVCHGCFQPMIKNEYYCENCGEGFSNTAPYMPFINIRHQANFFGGVWRWLLKPKTPILFILIFLTLGSLVWFPFNFLIPIFLYRLYKSKKKNSI